jgi:hypothetical protein
MEAALALEDLRRIEREARKPSDLARATRMLNRLSNAVETNWESFDDKHKELVRSIAHARTRPDDDGVVGRLWHRLSFAWRVARHDRDEILAYFNAQIRYEYAVTAAVEREHPDFTRDLGAALSDEGNLGTIKAGEVGDWLEQIRRSEV